MTSTSFLTGALPVILIAVASFFLLWLFRRAVLMDCAASDSPLPS